MVPGVLLENSVLAPGAGSVGARYNNSQVVIARNNTFVGGQYGAYFTGGSLDVTLLNNIFTGQTGAGVYFNSDSLMEVNDTGTTDKLNNEIIYNKVSYFGDGNVYNPASGGYVATVIDGTTNNYSTVSNYAKYWYTKQYGAGVINTNGDSGVGVGYRSDQSSILGAPASSTAAAAISGWPTSPRTSSIRAPLRSMAGRHMGVSPPVWDGQGNVRVQGNAVDAGAYETAGAITAKFTLTTAGTTSAGVYDSSG